MLFVIFFVSNLFATDILIQPTSTSDLDYQKALINQSQVISFSKAYQQQPSPIQKQLEDDLKVAQFEFLKGSIPRSIELFENIFEERHLYHWNLKSRKMVHYAILRLAQLKKEEQSKYLMDALLFDPEININSELFPPPMVSLFRQLKKNLRIDLWPLPKNIENFPNVLVNGRPVTTSGSFIRLAPGSYRFSFLSEKQIPVHMVVKTKDLSGLKLISDSLESEGCPTKDSKSLVSSSKKQLRVLGKSCLGFQRIADEKLTKEFSPKFDPSNGAKKESSILGSKWFWIGVSVVATGIAIHSYNQNQSNNPQPTQPTSPATPSARPAPIVISN